MAIPLTSLSGWASSRLPQQDVVRLLVDVDVTDDDVRRLRMPSPARPYGRRVFLDGEHLEGMMATWTPGIPCAPHDHGGASGGVRVLRGRCVHRVYDVRGDALALVREERLGPGAILDCTPELVHAMADGGDAEPLVTIHLYADPIAYMVVYDVDAHRTVVVDGRCGAWVPHDEPERIRGIFPGFVRNPQLLAEGPC